MSSRQDRDRGIRGGDGREGPESLGEDEFSEHVAGAKDVKDRIGALFRYGDQLHQAGLHDEQGVGGVAFAEDRGPGGVRLVDAQSSDFLGLCVGDLAEQLFRCLKGKGHGQRPRPSADRCVAPGTILPPGKDSITGPSGVTLWRGSEKKCPPEPPGGIPRAAAPPF